MSDYPWQIGIKTVKQENSMKSKSQQAFKIGVLFSKTGVTAAIETSQLMGTLFAIDQINESGGIHGVPIQTVYYDPESSPARYEALANKLIVEDGVRIIVGCYMSSTRKAVIPVIEKWNALLLYPTLYEGFEYSSNIIYTGAAPNQNSMQLAEFMLRNFGARVFMVGSDYIYPYESNRIMTDLIREQGGERTGEYYLPLNAPADAYLDIAKKIKASTPNFIFSTVVGSGTSLLYRAYAKLGLDPMRMPIASLTTSEVEVKEMGADIAEGHITSATYFQSVATKENIRAVSEFKKRYGDELVTNMCWEAAYFQTHLIANALRQTRSDNISRLLKGILGAQFQAPQGTIKVDEQNHHTYLWPRIGRVNAVGQFDILEESSQSVMPDPYLVEHVSQEWSSQPRLVGC
jgi:branched-chain amino acid transport system substrate-binding protein